jgi:hypothetical protein
MQVLAFMERTNTPSLGLGDGVVYQRQDAIELVDHFLDYRELWIGSHISQGIIQKHGFPMALDASYLLHAMLVRRCLSTRVMTCADTECRLHPQLI